MPGGPPQAFVTELIVITPSSNQTGKLTRLFRLKKFVAVLLSLRSRVLLLLSQYEHSISFIVNFRNILRVLKANRRA